MTETKKTRIMSPRGFLHKASGKVSADAFLAQHRAWLQSGDLATLTTPILVKLDNKEVLPTPALEEIKGAVLSHMLLKEATKNEDAILNPPPAATPKPWIATVYNAKGEVQTKLNAKGEEVDIQEGFILGQDAERWTDRRLVEGASDWYGVIAHTVMTHNGEPLSQVILRDDAMARVFQEKKGPAMKSQSKSAGKLSFGVKVHNDRSIFSKG